MAAGPAYGRAQYRLEDRPELELRLMQPAAAESLGGDLAAMVPWARLGTSRDQLTGFLSASDDNKRSFSIIADGGLAGVIVVRFPWLSGPYLNLLAVLDGQRSKGVGRAALGWFEAEARAAGARNAFLCVSAFNAPAIAFYRRNGYSQATVLEDLIKDGEDEFLMRKRLR